MYYYVVEAVPDTKHKTLHVISAYINKNDTFSGVAVSNDPSRYVQDEPQSNVSSSKDIISQTEKKETKNIQLILMVLSLMHYMVNHPNMRQKCHPLFRKALNH